MLSEIDERRWRAYLYLAKRFPKKYKITREKHLVKGRFLQLRQYGCWFRWQSTHYSEGWNPGGSMQWGIVDSIFISHDDTRDMSGYRVSATIDKIIKEM